MGDPVRPGPITQRLVGQGPCALPGVRYKAGRRGEGTPPYGGLQGARKNERGRTPPLRGAYKECGKAGRRGRRPLRVVTRGAGRAESPGHGFAVTVPFRQGAKGTGDADCHSQCAHWLRNDRGVTRGAVGNRLADRGVRPYNDRKETPQGVRIATTSDIGHWFRNDRGFYKGCGVRDDVGIVPYGVT